MIPAADVSQYQGTIDWATMPPIALIKMSGGDNGLYVDPDAATNYNNAKANGKAVGGYHFIGWVVGASAEATYFLQAMSPLAEYDVYALDIEAIPSGVNPVSYVTEMVNLIHSKINVWPLLYMNVSTLRSYDWSSLLTNCGLWLADWNNDPQGTIPNVPIYVMQQYSDGPNYDHDEWFGTVDEFKAYGYHAPVATPTPTPAVSTPQPVQVTVSNTESVTTPPAQATEPVVTHPIVPEPVPEKTNNSLKYQTNTIQNKPLSTGSVSTLGQTSITSSRTRTGFWTRLWDWLLSWIR